MSSENSFIEMFHTLQELQSLNFCEKNNQNPMLSVPMENDQDKPFISYLDRSIGIKRWKEAIKQKKEELNNAIQIQRRDESISSEENNERSS